MKVKNCTLIEPLHCKKDDNAVIVAQKLRDAKQRRCIVVDDMKPVGIISTTDMNNKVVADNLNAKETMAEEIMTSPLYLVADYEDDLNEIFEKMVEHKSFFVPVTRDSELLGILTYGELKARIQEVMKDEP